MGCMAYCDWVPWLLAADVLSSLSLSVSAATFCLSCTTFVSNILVSLEFCLKALGIV